VVVGGGIVGVATACALLDDGWEVTVLTPEAVGDGGAAIGSAGLFATQTVQPLGTPGIARRIPRMLIDPDAPLSIRLAYLPRLLPWFARFLRSSTGREVERLSHALADLLKEALTAYAPLLAAADAGDLVKQKGLVTVYRTAEQLAAARPEIALRERRGIPLQILSDAALRQMAPALAPDYKHGVFYPRCGHTGDPRALLLALWRSVESRGGRFVQDAARGFAASSRSVTAVMGDAATYPADAVVVAAGAWSGPLARSLGFDVPLDTERGYHVTLADPGIDLPVPLIAGDVRFAITPMRMGVRLAGTIEFAGLRAPPDPRRHRMLLRQGRACLPGLNIDKPSLWMGFRPSLPDSLPVIGRSPGHANAYFAFGHGHLGVTGAAITGRIVAALAAGRRPPIDIEPFRIDRFQ
jgi:D-amino-acid dehydrogenase